MHELELPAVEQLGHALVLVLIRDDRPQSRVALRLERVEEAAQLLRAAHRRDDEVERRRALRHEP